jgi:hypothetical protein
MLPAANSIPKPRAVESKMIFYCGCGKPFTKQASQETHSSKCEVLIFAKELKSKYEKIYIPRLLKDEIMGHLNLKSKVFLSDNKMTFVLRDDEK